MRPLVKIGLWVLIIAVGLGGLYFFASRSASQASAALLSQVQQVEATRGPFERVTRVVGALEPLEQADVVARVSGIVAELPVREGDQVAAGDLILALDPSDLRLNLQQAQASLRAAQAELAALANQPTPVKRLEARNNVAAAEAEVARLEAEVASARSLARAGALSPQELRQKEESLAAAQRSLRLAQEHLAELERGATEYELERARAQVAQAEAEVARAEENLRRSRIAAPMAGAVLELNTRLGQSVEAGMIVARLGRTDELEVVAPVNEMDVPSIRIGQAVRVQADAVRGETFEGTVIAVAPQGNRDQNVATFDVTISLANPDQRLRPGMTATAEILLDRLEDVVQVPLEAIVRDGDQDVVVVLDADGTARVVPVTLGIRNDQAAEVKDGLAGGETLVVLPAGLSPQQYVDM
ncbi:MAG TPA: efflux RND transporter periplasmic adaptor subunit, partial [Limnochorda sp.]